MQARVLGGQAPKVPERIPCAPVLDVLMCSANCRYSVAFGAWASMLLVLDLFGRNVEVEVVEADSEVSVRWSVVFSTFQQIERNRRLIVHHTNFELRRR